MNAGETADLCRLVATLCPQQRMVAADKASREIGTAAAWFVLLQDLRHEDAATGVQRIARRQSFIDPKDIIAEVKLLRAERLDALPEARRPTPNVDPEDLDAYRAELLAIREAIADGRMTPENAHQYGGPTRPTITGARPLLAIGAAPEVTRPLDLRQVFAQVPKPKAERKAREDDEEARRRAHAQLAAWEKRREDRLKAKARNSRQRPT